MNGPLARRGGGSSGFTLLELLLVILILSAAAMLAFTSLESSHDQVRFEDTRARVERVRTAILGEGGADAAAGFLNDVGRLPDSVDELLRDTESPTLPAWSFDENVGLWAGWRGPYLPLGRSSSGTELYTDGWGLPISPATLSTHGWRRFERLLDGTAFFVQSFGSDGASGGVAYAADYPPDLTLGGLPLPVVAEGDAFVDLRGTTIELTITNDGDVGYDLPAARLRCWYPLDGSFAWPPGTWPATETARDQSPWLSESIPPQTIAPHEVAIVVVRFLAPSLATAQVKRVPAGLRGFSLVGDSDGETIGPAQPAHTYRLAARAGAPRFSMTWKASP